MKQKTLSEMCESSNSHINQIECGNKQPSLTMLKKISISLGVPLPIMMFLSMSREDIVQTKMESFSSIKETLDDICHKVIGNEQIRTN